MKRIERCKATETDPICSGWFNRFFLWWSVAGIYWIDRPNSRVVARLLNSSSTDCPITVNRLVTWVSVLIFISPDICIILKDKRTADYFIGMTWLLNNNTVKAIHFTDFFNGDRIQNAEELGTRLTVGQQTLNLYVEVRILCPQLT